ncbi:hypothetical protein M434DRAFT_395658, partial [Hypoxylon sp. CO27-5]
MYLEETSTQDLWESRKKLDEQDDVTRICNSNEAVEASNSRDSAYYFSSPPKVSSANSPIPPLTQSPSRRKRGVPNSHAKDEPISSQNALVIRTTATIGAPVHHHNKLKLLQEKYSQPTFSNATKVNLTREKDSIYLRSRARSPLIRIAEIPFRAASETRIYSRPKLSTNTRATYSSQIRRAPSYKQQGRPERPIDRKNTAARLNPNSPPAEPSNFPSTTCGSTTSTIALPSRWLSYNQWRKEKLTGVEELGKRRCDVYEPEKVEHLRARTLSPLPVLEEDPGIVSRMRPRHDHRRQSDPVAGVSRSIDVLDQKERLMHIDPNRGIRKGQGCQASTSSKMDSTNSSNTRQGSSSFLSSEVASTFTTLSQTESEVLNSSMNEDSDDGHSEEDSTYIQQAEKRRTLLRDLMDVVYSTYPPFSPSNIMHHGETNSSSNGQKGPTDDNTSHNQQSKSGSPKGKRALLRRDENNDNDEDDEHLRPKRTKLGVGDDKANLKRTFACPFYQRIRHRGNVNAKLPRGACYGPGFPSIHRLRHDYLYSENSL